MRSRYAMNVTFNADDVDRALEAAQNQELLCRACIQKITTQLELSQSDFCPGCQAVITSHLVLDLEERMRAELVRQGLPLDTLEIVSD
jgi:hypothetical protein